MSSTGRDYVRIYRAEVCKQCRSLIPRGSPFLPPHPSTLPPSPPPLPPSPAVRVRNQYAGLLLAGNGNSKKGIKGEEEKGPGRVCCAVTRVNLSAVRFAQASSSVLPERDARNEEGLRNVNELNMRERREIARGDPMGFK